MAFAFYPIEVFIVLVSPIKFRNLVPEIRNIVVRKVQLSSAVATLDRHKQIQFSQPVKF
jgi:hypothetical protein